MTEVHKVNDVKRPKDMEDRERERERAVPRGAFAAKLRKLAEHIEEGRAFRIQVAGERLSVPARATFSIEHEREGTVEEIDFQIKWERQ